VTKEYFLNVCPILIWLTHAVYVLLLLLLLVLLHDLYNANFEDRVGGAAQFTAQFEA